MNEIMVSICCLAYNHEKYIRQTLEGFLMQKTEFIFEILIHDDASTDGTKDVIKEYEEKYPNIIKPIYQNENQYSKGIAISRTYQFPRAKGKYIAMCEGDDFWTDEYKLQKQFDALEHYPQCTICTHIVSDVNENGEHLGSIRPKLELINIMSQGTIASKELFDDILIENIIPFQTSSFFFKRIIVEQYLKELPAFAQTKGFGDAPLLWYCIAKGPIYFIPESMSNYRKDRPGSWTVTCFASRQYLIQHFQQLIHMVQNYNIYTHKEFEKSITKIYNQFEFLLYEAQGEYRKLLKRKYRIMWRKRNLKEKIYILLCAFLPGIEDVYLKLKKAQRE